MAGWVGPMIAVSILVIALCYVGLIVLAVGTARAAASRSETLAKQLSALREELGPTLETFKRLGRQRRGHR